MPIRFRNDSGFSLTEIIVVIAIIGLLVALAVPNFLDWNRKAQLRDAVSSLAWNMNLARMNAINQNANVTVTVCHQVSPCVLNPNPTPTQVTVFFRNSVTGNDVAPSMTMASDIALTKTDGSLVPVGVNAPQDVAFNPLGLKMVTGTGADLCINSAGNYTGAPCVASNAQVLNFRSLTSNYNYRIVVLSTGKISWCTDATCTQ